MLRYWPNIAFNQFWVGHQGKTKIAMIPSRGQPFYHPTPNFDLITHPNLRWNPTWFELFYSEVRGTIPLYRCDDFEWKSEPYFIYPAIETKIFLTSLISQHNLSIIWSRIWLQSISGWYDYGWNANSAYTSKIVFKKEPSTIYHIYWVQHLSGCPKFFAPSPSS